MRLSQLFARTLREAPADAEAPSHQLLIRAAFIRRLMAGVYIMLPLGFRSLRKIEEIVRSEMDGAGAQEIRMPILLPSEPWKITGRWQAYGNEMFKLVDRGGRDLGLGPTQEEVVTPLVAAEFRSYRDLPVNLYQVEWKYRDELRPRFGLVRGREFLMKDAYSFDVDLAGATPAYNRMFGAYLRTFGRMGLRAIPMVADTGPIGGNLSHEFIILASTGESEVYCHRDYLDVEVPGEGVDFDDVAGLQKIVDRWTGLYAATSEKHDAAVFAKLPPDKQVSARGIEVGHIFYFGTKYSEPMKAVVAGPDGVERPVHMGSYGIGPSRLVAAIIEAFHDDAGIKWPEAVAPFRAAVLNLKQGSPDTDAACERIYGGLMQKGVDTLYHDLDERAGSKFAAMDLIGVPWQVVVGPKGLAEGKVELKRRLDGSRELLTPEEVIARLTSDATH